VLLENIAVQKNQHITYPNDGSEMVKIPDNDSFVDMEAAILSDDKLELSAYEKVGAALASEKAYKFDELLRLISKYQVSSIIIRIKDGE
jgi:hypothetical protein